MPSEEIICDTVDVGDFSALFGQLDAASPSTEIDGGYAKLFARLNSAEYRRKCGLVSN